MAGKIFDSVVDVAGGRDFSSIDDALDSTKTVLVKSGTYSSDATITVDQDNTLLKIEPGTIINANTGGLVISADDCQIEIGPGCTIDNNSSASALSITVSGANNSIKIRNGCTIGNVSISSTGDQTKFDGGGFGTVIESMANSGDDCIIIHGSYNSKTNSTGLDAIEVDGSANGRGLVLFNNVIDSDNDGIALKDANCLALGNNILDADDDGFVTTVENNRIIANICEDMIGWDVDHGTLGDNLVYIANIFDGVVRIYSVNDDLVFVGNHIGTMLNSSATSIIQHNTIA